MADHLDSVRAYDSEADEAVVKNLVNHLGIALRNRDSANVATSDPNELKTIREGFCKKKLDLSDDEAAKAVDAAAEDMKGDRNKDRVAFYYLVAKHAGKLDSLA